MFTFTKLLLTSHLYYISAVHPSLIPGRLQHEVEIITNRKPCLQEMEGLPNCIFWLVNNTLLHFQASISLQWGWKKSYGRWFYDTLPCSAPDYFQSLYNWRIPKEWALNIIFVLLIWKSLSESVMIHDFSLMSCEWQTCPTAYAVWHVWYCSLLISTHSKLNASSRSWNCILTFWSHLCMFVRIRVSQ